jgi:hypothetical protein
MISALTPSKVVDTNSQLADALYEGSEVLQNITDMFAPLMKNFRIYFFWEQEKTDLGGSLGYVCISVSPILSSLCSVEYLRQLPLFPRGVVTIQIPPRSG